MQNIRWIIQSNLIKESVLQEIKTILIKNKVKFEEVKIIPFSNELPAIQKSADLKVFYGSTTLILNAHETGSFSTGIFYDKEIFSMKNYFKQWGIHMLNYDSEILTFSQIVDKDYKGEEWFVRPIFDDKSFSGQVMTYEEIEKLEKSLADSNNPYLDQETLVTISKPKIIQKEWRHFIVDKKIISSSKYAQDGIVSKSSQDVPLELLDFVNARCSEYTPHDIFVMDTALCNDTFKIVECNCFNDTGFYDHNIQKIIEAVNTYLKMKL